MSAMPERGPTTPYEALLQFLYQTPVGLVQTDNDGAITLVNPMAAQLLMPLAPGGDLSNLYDVLGAHAPGLRARAGVCRSPGEEICDGLRVHLGEAAPPGAPRVLALRMLRLDAATLMASVRDVTLEEQREAVRLQSRLREVSRLDALTGLPNRVAARERILAGLRRDAVSRLAVLFMDIDRFSHVNTGRGQAVGDEFLRQFGRRLAAELQPGVAELPTAPVAARLGDDKFAAVLDGPDWLEDPVGAAGRLLQAMGRPYVVGGQAVQLTVSAGLVVVDKPTEPDGDPGALLEDARLATREARLAGGGRMHVYDASLRVRLQQRAAMEATLRRALQHNELHVVYQPIVALGNGAPVGAEALARWQHPQRGAIPPSEFIGVAEACGLIGAVGGFVLRQACVEFARWRAQPGGARLQVLSVNLSRAQLLEQTDGPGIQQVVREALADSGLAPALLQLEITESLAAQDEQVQAQLRRLKALGVKLALDDFGTGYSSLSSLHQLPVDAVKIDRSFVSQIETSAHHQVLVEATVRVARSLGMQTVAEGIETAGQAALLASCGCDKGQGYFYARPLPPSEAAHLLLGGSL